MTVSSFMDAFKKHTAENPIGEGRVYRNESLVRLEPFSGGIHLYWLQALQPKKGAGTRALSLVTTLADVHDVSVTLFASPEPKGKGNISTAALKKFYGAHGFKTASGDGFMKRMPQKIPNLVDTTDAVAETVSARFRSNHRLVAAVERAAFFVALSAMSMDEAKRVLGFQPNENPSKDEVAKAWRKLAMKHHPDRGGNPELMIEVNVAKDILDGTRRPDRTRGPTTGGAPPPPPPPPPRPASPPPPKSEGPKQQYRPDSSKTGNTAIEAARAAGADKLDWLGVFPQKPVGFDGDESTNMTFYHVAVTLHTDADKLNLALISRNERSNINEGKSTTWSVLRQVVSKKETVIVKAIKDLYESNARGVTTTPPRAQTSRFAVTTNVGGNLFEVLQKDFRLVSAPIVSLAAVLSAVGLVPKEKRENAPKTIVEIHYKQMGELGYGDPKVGFAVDGAEPVWINDDDDNKIFRMIVTKVFGPRIYVNQSKVLNRLPKRREFIEHILGNFRSLPKNIRNALEDVLKAS